MNIIWFIVAAGVFEIVYCYFLCRFLFAVGLAAARKLKEKAVDNTKHWYFSWPAIVTGLLTVQFAVQCCLASLPEAPSTSELYDWALLLYMILVAFVVVGKLERDSRCKSLQRDCRGQRNNSPWNTSTNPPEPQII